MDRREYLDHDLEGYSIRIWYDAGDGGGRFAGGSGTDWDWIYGRVATALSILPSAIDDEPCVNIFKLLKYWVEEPPTHVILALRYLGQKTAKPAISEEQAQQQMADMSQMLGKQARALPPNLAELIRDAEQIKQQHKGLIHAG